MNHPDVGEADIKSLQRGVPIGHIFQQLFGELIIFTMDLAVNQKANMLLYRLHDDLWLCGEPEKCAKAWTTVEHCAKVLGLQFNNSLTGSVYLTDKTDKASHIERVLPTGKVILGFLELDTQTGDWAIDHKKVDTHIKQLRKQLAGCNSIFSWIQTWNSCIGRFFNYTFGQPANCFGQRHVDQVLATHRSMQQELFADSERGDNSSSVTEYLKRTIGERFAVTDVPDAFLYFPEELGGLGVRNPFIPFLVVQRQLLQDPKGRMSEFLEEERKAYKDAKAKFDRLNEADRNRRLISILGKGNQDSQFIPISIPVDDSNKHRELSWAGPTDTEFMSFDDYTRYRETSSEALKSAYDDLLLTPTQSDAHPSREVKNAISHLSFHQPELSWTKLSSDRKWLIQLYSEQAFEKFGRLSIVDQELLPMGVMTSLRNRKVTWQTVL